MSPSHGCATNQSMEAVTRVTTSQLPTPVSNQPSCCSVKRHSDPEVQLPLSLPQDSSSTLYPPDTFLAVPSHLSDPLPGPSASTSNLTLDMPYDASGEMNMIPDPLFAPQTAGTALCFCGIHCPCPGTH